jgi:hypothetical protein
VREVEEGEGGYAHGVGRCDTRFAKKRSWELFFLFFFPHPVVVLGIWNFVKNIHN